MTNFNWGGRGLSYGQRYVYSMQQNRLRHYVSRTIGTQRNNVSRVIIIFCVLFSLSDLLGCSVLARTQHREVFSGLIPVIGQQSIDSSQVVSTRPYNFSLYEGIAIKPILSEKRLAAERRKYPKVDFNKFLMQSYKVDEDKIPKLHIGGKLPDSVLDMPLRVVNDAYGRDTITLRSCMDREWIILDIWTEWCVPCIGSMNKWESLSKQADLDFTLLGVYASYEAHRAMPEARKKGYESTQIIGPGTLLLTHLFFQGKGSLGPSIWIKDGRFFGISQAGMLTDDDYHLLLSGRLGAIPEYARWKLIENQD